MQILILKGYERAAIATHMPIQKCPARSTASIKKQEVSLTLKAFLPYRIRPRFQYA